MTTELDENTLLGIDKLTLLCYNEKRFYPFMIFLSLNDITIMKAELDLITERDGFSFC